MFLMSPIRNCKDKNMVPDFNFSPHPSILLQTHAHARMRTHAHTHTHTYTYTHTHTLPRTFLMAMSLCFSCYCAASLVQTLSGIPTK